MEKLDADTNPLYSEAHKKYQSRDNVQFLAFREFASSSEALCKEVLAEIPDQMLQYYQGKNIKPEILNQYRTSNVKNQQAVLPQESIQKLNK